MVRLLGGPYGYELVQQHVPCVPSFSDSIAGDGVEAREVLAERSRARLLHLLREFPDALFDFAFFLLLPRGLAVAQEPAALPEVIKGASEFIGGKPFVERTGAQYVRKDVGQRSNLLFRGFLGLQPRYPSDDLLFVEPGQNLVPFLGLLAGVFGVGGWCRRGGQEPRPLKN
jgi:hypothetical protein